LQLALRNPLNLEKKSPAVAPATPAAPAMAVATAEAPKRVVQRSNGGGAGITVIRGTEAKVVNIR
jgi:pilus assembly protein CpaB